MTAKEQGLPELPQNVTEDQRRAIQAFVHSAIAPLIEDVIVKKLGQAAIVLRDELAGAALAFDTGGRGDAEAAAKVADILNYAGWRAVGDAQWTRLASVIPELRAALRAQPQPVEGGESAEPPSDEVWPPDGAIWLAPVATDAPANPKLMQYAWGRSSLSSGQMAEAYQCIVSAAQECGQAIHLPVATTPPESGDPLKRMVCVGDLPAPITNSEAWPPNYADGFNAACELQRQCAPTYPPESGGQGWEVVPEHVRKLIGQIDCYRLRMSYNESYFGEPAGLLKGVFAELGHAANPIYPSGKTALYPGLPAAPAQPDGVE